MNNELVPNVSDEQLIVWHEERLARIRARNAGEEWARDSLRELLARHAALVADDGRYPYYCYFELAYTRQTQWMAWICSKPREDDPDRKVIACGQGETPDEACEAALQSMPVAP